MAENKETKKPAEKKVEKKSNKVEVTVMAPRDEVREGFMVYVNGVPTYVPYNETVEVPVEVAEVINNSNKAAQAQRKYIDEHRA